MNVCRAFSDFIVGLLAILGFEEELLLQEDPFILTIKRGVLCMQREEYDKAELILHTALKQAQNLMHEKAETYILAVLANVAFEKKDYKKCETLYKTVLSRVLSKGIKEDDESVIAMSLKLAKIYSEKHEFENAEHGFSFCLRHQSNRLQSIDVNAKLTDEEINSVALWGQILDWYSKHLLLRGDKQSALKYANDAFHIAVTVKGMNDSHTITLLNDLGSIYNDANQFEKAIECYNKAVKLGEINDSEHLATYYHNLGVCYLHAMNKELARTACQSSLRIAKQDKNVNMQTMAKECLRKCEETV
ncbi:Tetratricopeptide repeat protein 19-like protein [Leptotrombidium deliense]|uniref:Tetratricopeptide repeat protein 19-like protein n=1 Tax=Leptotrombidium deliense TaxID=299467 RepID=A0A443SEH0_9ACAR|nr:Tetratricopeptide repeat protein 19-like protein [Leptotrombidium deliense]